MNRRTWAGQKLLITAGPTREFLDPVRYLSNRSSGQLGLALATAAKKRGAQVTLVLGPISIPPPTGIKVVSVVSAKDMDMAVQKNLKQQDVFIACAAVADWMPQTTSRQKWKKDTRHTSSLLLKLVKTPDVLARAAQKRTKKKPVLVGFSLETQSHLKNAEKKLKKKKIDMIVANDAKTMDSPNISATILSSQGDQFLFRQGTKAAFATFLLNSIQDFRISL